MIGRPSIRIGIRAAQHLLLVGFAMSAAALADGTGTAPRAALAFVLPAVYANDLEGSLVRAIVNLKQQGLKQAMVEIDDALERHPNFRLGYLVKGDMLMARAGKPVAFASSAATADEVAPLQDEARVRLQRYLDAPKLDALPAPVLQLSPSQPHVLLVDTSRNRLYVYANDAGRPKYLADFYVSIGKLGAEKQRAGDQKTPTGVYRIISARDRLPDFYGPGAFPLDYPNDWDKLHHRDGSGIWLHGTPSTTYSRPPLATDGCIVLTNEDFAKVSRFVDVTRTPVVIGQGFTWQEPRQWEAARNGFLSTFDRWQRDWESRDTERYFSHYSQTFRSDSQDLQSWKAQKRKVNSGKEWVKVAARNVSLFAYPGTNDVMMVTFEQDYRSSNLSNRRMKRQFWAREGTEWRIVHETVVS